MYNTTINSLYILFVYYNIFPILIKIEQINYPMSILIIYFIESPCHTVRRPYYLLILYISLRYN